MSPATLLEVVRQRGHQRTRKALADENYQGTNNRMAHVHYLLEQMIRTGDIGHLAFCKGVCWAENIATLEELECL